MPQGTYDKGYIMGQMSKQGVMNEASEGSLYREGLDQMLLGSTDLNSYNVATPKPAGNRHMGQAGYIMGQMQKQGYQGTEG